MRIAHPVAPRLAPLSLTVLLAACANTPAAPPTSAAGTHDQSHITTQALSVGRAYHVDCKNGRDGNTGLSPSQAWKTLVKANEAALQPGEALLFKRGCSWDGQLVARWDGSEASPVIIGAYGSGSRPRFRTVRTQLLAIDVRGSYQILEHLEPVVGNRPGPSGKAVNCPKTPLGWRVGFAVHGNHNTIQHSSASRFTAAIHFASGATANKAIGNTLKNNDIMSRNDADGGDNDSGAWGVVLNGNDNEVAHNTFGGNIACSEDYGVEGASVEIYQASGNFIHHNRSINDGTFSELGGLSERNTIAFNLFAPTDTLSQQAAEFLVVRGNAATKAYHNTAYKVQVGVACFDGCGASVLDFRNNIVIGAQDARKPEFSSDADAAESHNAFGRIDGDASYQRNKTSQHASSTLLLTREQTAALFVDAVNLNFQLSGSSAAVNIGTALGDARLSRDLDGNPVPFGAAPDAGSYERQY